jgi:MFS family permease
MALRDRPAHIALAFRAVFANRDLRRLAIAFTLFGLARWANRITIFIVAFQRGGTAETGFVAAIMLVPAALIAPLASILGDEMRRDRALVLGYALQTILAGATAAAFLLESPIAVVYGFAVLLSASGTLTWPVQSALIPQFARSPHELTAMNAVDGFVYGGVALLGPAAAGLLIAIAGAGLVFAVFTLFLLAATLMVVGLDPRPHPAHTGKHRLAEATAGFAAVLRHPDQRLVVGLLAGQSVLAGAMDVLLVAITLGLLGLPESAGGFTAAARGIGGLIGGVWAMELVGRRDLAMPLRASLLVFGIGATSMAFSTVPLLTAALVVVAAAGYVRADTVGAILLQRVVPDEILARVFGVVEGMYLAALAAGSALAPLLVAAIGVRGAVVAAGLLLPAVVALIGGRIRSVDLAAKVPERELELLRSLDLFRSLPAHKLEDVAWRLLPVSASPGDVVIREGDPGDRFYVVDDGEVSVSQDGRPLTTLGPGTYFGEIALLHDVPRVATVTAVTQTSFLALDRGEFLEALMSHPQSHDAAEITAEERLEKDEQR